MRCALFIALGCGLVFCVRIPIAFIAERASRWMALGAKLLKGRAAGAMAFVPWGGMGTDVHRVALRKVASKAPMAALPNISRMTSKWSSVVFILLNLTGSLSAVQPMPDGAFLQWRQSEDKGWSNFLYAVWAYPPGSTNEILLTNNYPFASYRYVGAVPQGMMFGVTVKAQTNGVWYVADVSIADWPPNVASSPRTLKITPDGGTTVATGRWAKVSYDLTNYVEWLRFHTPTAGVVKVEHQFMPDRRMLFMAYPTIATPPMPGGGK